MLDTIFASKMGMSQAWTKEGKRLPITKLRVAENIVVSLRPSQSSGRFTDQIKRRDCQLMEIGYGKKKLKNVKKPLASQLKKSGFSFGVRQIRGINVFDATEDLPQAGSQIQLSSVLKLGDVVEVQGKSKGRGFAGGVKRHGFAGGPKTHGQSDRLRAIGSIGAGTTPGRVWKGKRMAGHMGVDTKTVSGLVVVYIDEQNNELWLTGPVPGFKTSTIRIRKTGKKSDLVLDPASLPRQEEKAVDLKEADKEADKEIDQEPSKEIDQEADKKTDKKIDQETETPIKEESEEIKTEELKK